MRLLQLRMGCLTPRYTCAPFFNMLSRHVVHLRCPQCHVFWARAPVLRLPVYL